MRHTWKAGVITATVVWGVGLPPFARSVSADGVRRGAWDERAACLVDGPRIRQAEDRACAWPDAAANNRSKPTLSTPCAAPLTREGGARLACIAGPPSSVPPVIR